MTEESERIARYIARFDTLIQSVPGRVLAVAMSRVMRGIDYRGCSKAALRAVAFTKWSHDGELSSKRGLKLLKEKIDEEQKRIDDAQRQKHNGREIRQRLRQAVLRECAELTDILGCIESGLTCDHASKLRFFKWAQDTLNARIAQES